MELNGRVNDLKMASFLVFFKMSLFQIQSTFFCKASWEMLSFALRERSLIIPGRGPEGKFVGYETKTVPENLMGYETNFEISDGPRNQFLYYQKKFTKSMNF